MDVDSSRQRMAAHMRDLVNDVLTRYRPGIIATVCLVVPDPDSGSCRS
jgi:hypothetical protein